MDKGSLIFSLLFLAAFAIYLYFAIYIIYINPKRLVNRIFFLLSLSLSIWAFGFALSNSAPTMETALYWRRISALGWSVVCSLSLHCLLALTQKDLDNDKKKKYLLLHIPAIISMYAFSISDKLAIPHHNLIRTAYGWKNISINDIWDTFFYFYCGIYLMVSFYYAIRKYDFMKGRKNTREIPIINNKTKEKLYYYLSLSFITLALLAVASLFIDGLSMNPTTLGDIRFISVMLFSFAAIVLLAQIIKSEKLKDAIMLGIAVLSIPIISLHFIDSAGITVWAFPIILMMFSLLLDTSIPLVMILITSIWTQISLWFMGPKDLGLVNDLDYVFRIGMYIVAFFIGMMVNVFYRKRLKENVEQAESQKLISDISFDFIRVNQDNIDEKIDKMLNEMGRFLSMDWAFVYLIDPDTNSLQATNLWPKQEGAKERANIDLSGVPCLINELKMGEVIYLDKNSNKVSIKEEVSSFYNDNTSFLTLLPLGDKNELAGFMGIAMYSPDYIWLESELALIKVLANLLTDGLMKIKAEREIEFMAYYDQLTILPNRTLFSDRLNQAIQLAKRSEKFIGVVLMDLDSFKIVNDTIGHTSGDEIIKEVAKSLLGCLRQIDTVARFGGDEFIIMINNISEAGDIERVVDKISNIFSKPFVVDNNEFFITSSTGVAVYPYDGDEVDSLIKNADTAMYRAKARGKNQYVFCTDEMKEEVKKNIVLSNNLYRAQERGELSIHYQPQVEISTGRIVGLEALLRWKHPELGMISPGVFIPLAEKSGLINSIGDWVLTNAIRQNKEWQDQGFPHLRMAVNLSVIQFNNPRIAENVARIIKDVGLKPEYLELEITESIATKESSIIGEALNELKDLGISISIDDFGTEYSSLGRLKTLPIDRIKIDMQFIQGIEHSDKDKAITQIIINLAKSLGLKVIAEGVETETQLDFLDKEECDEVQGYFYYRPMPAKDIDLLLKSMHAGNI